EQHPKYYYSDRREFHHPNRLKHQGRCSYSCRHSNRFRIRIKSGTSWNWNGGGNCLRPGVASPLTNISTPFKVESSGSKTSGPQRPTPFSYFATEAARRSTAD